MSYVDTKRKYDAPKNSKRDLQDRPSHSQNCP